YLYVSAAAVGRLPPQQRRLANWAGARRSPGKPHPFYSRPPFPSGEAPRASEIGSLFPRGHLAPTPNHGPYYRELRGDPRRAGAQRRLRRVAYLLAIRLFVAARWDVDRLWDGLRRSARQRPRVLPLGWTHAAQPAGSRRGAAGQARTRRDARRARLSADPFHAR